MKNTFILFAIFLHSFLIFITFYVASPSSFAVATKPSSSLGCAADPKGAAAFERGSAALAHE